MSPPPPINISQQIQHKNPNKNLLKVSQLKSAASSSGEGVVRRKKKLVSQGGQKWFKGSPRKSRANNNNNGGGTTTVITLSGHHQQQAGTMGAYLGSNQNILHHSGMESPPPLPPLLVQFSLEGLPDFRLSIYDKLNLTSKENDEVGWTGLTVSSKSRQKKKSKVPPKEVKGDEGVKGDEKGEGGVESKIVDVAVKPLPQPLFHEIYEYELLEASPLPNAYIRWMERPGEELTEDVEYDVDEEDSAWLNLINKDREGVGGRVSLEVMELLMDRLEKESYLQMQVTGMDQRPVIDDDAVCCICMDGECQNSNAILFCDMCNLAVHQECYGVPYIPEGQWLCRRCLQSPSRAVDCVLCPNKGGAFKQTDDGRWAHVVCAIWIPEVCFANTVFLEPVDSVTNIPPARWRLCCFICKYKGRGACIQCHKSNCYTAFHVTCAQHAGLCMKMETVRVGSTLTVRKTAYCDNHAPPDFIRNRDGDSPTVRQKLKACRKMLAEKRSAIPMVSIPTIPPERLTQISSSVTFARKNQFIKRLLSYWKLKRIKRNGVPLLRRLQAASNHPPTANKQTHQLSFPQHVESWRGEYKYLLRLRQDLEKARLLCELIKKREKEKKEFVTLAENQWELELCPLARFFNNILNELKGKDTGEIFAEPVDPQAVPDYSRVIKNPMDLSTMKEKVSAFQYHSLSALEADFRLMIDNCLLYNNKDTVFYRAGVKMRESGRLIFREAERMAQQIGFDFDSGLHLATLSSAAQQRKLDSLQTDEEICQEIDNFLASEDRWTLPFTHHISNLEDLMDKAIGLGKPIARQRKYQKLRNEISRVKRMSRTPTTCSNANNNAYSSDAQSICSSPTNINIMSPGSEPIQSRGGNNTPNKKQRRTSTVSSKSSPLPPPINNNNNNNNKSVTSVGRRLRNKSLVVGEEEVENSVRTRPPKRRVVEALEKEAVRRRGSIYKTTLSNCVSSPSSSNLERGAESVTQTTPSSAPTTRLRRVRKSSQSVVKVFQSPPSTKTRGRKGKEIDEGGRVTRMVSNGLVSSPHSLRNGPKGVLENTGGGRRKGQHVNSHRGELKDSFSVYRETEMNSEGESEGEEPDDEEGAVTEEEEAQSSSTSSSSTSSSSDDEEEEEEESSDASSISPPMSLRGNSGGNNLRNVVGKKLRNLSPSTSGESSEDNSDSEEEEGSSSEGEQTRSKVTNKSKKKKGKRLKLKDDDEGSSDDEIEQGGRKSVNLEEIPLEPLSVVWAKCGDGVWSAALIIDPEMEPDFQKNGVSIPAPPNDVLLKRPGGPRRRKTDKNIFLVLFFDKSRPRWEWVCRSELEPLGVDPELDQGHMKQGGQPACKRTRLAYEKALLHRRRTDGAGLQPFLHNQNQLPISPPSE